MCKMLFPDDVSAVFFSSLRFHNMNKRHTSVIIGGMVDRSVVRAVAKCVR